MTDRRTGGAGMPLEKRKTVETITDLWRLYARPPCGLAGLGVKRFLPSKVLLGPVLVPEILQFRKL
jgi:hypothetical protein